MAGPAPKKPVVATPVTPTPVVTKTATTVPAKVATTSSPAAASPVVKSAVKSPAAQAYIASQATTPQITTPTKPTTPTPTVPTTPTTSPVPEGPTAKESYISAYKAYQEAQTQNQDVANAKTAYNDYVANQAKSVAGREGRGLGIPLQIVRGEQEKLLKQTQPEAQRLQGDVSIAEQAHTNKVNALKTGVDLAKTMAEIDADATKTAYQKEQDKLKLESDAKKLAFDQQIAEKKFDEDKRQFGLDYAIKQREVAVKEQDARTKSIEAKAKSTEGATANATKDADALSSLNLVNTLLQNTEGIKGIAGPIKGQGLFGVDALKLSNLNLSSDTQVAKNQYEQLKGILSLENRGKLKGQGAVSDFEGKTLERAASSLGTNLTPTEFTKQLKQVRGSIATSHGQPANVLLVDPKTGSSQVVSSNSAGISQAIKDGLLVEYQ